MTLVLSQAAPIFTQPWYQQYTTPSSQSRCHRVLHACCTCSLAMCHAQMDDETFRFFMNLKANFMGSQTFYGRFLLLGSPSAHQLKGVSASTFHRIVCKVNIHKRIYTFVWILTCTWWTWWGEKSCWRTSTNSRVDNRQNSGQQSQGKGASGNSFRVLVKAIAFIIPGLTGKPTVAEVHAIQRYNWSWQNAATNLICIHQNCEISRMMKSQFLKWTRKSICT